jgi:membrane associated rhomboid family serine protease
MSIATQPETRPRKNAILTFLTGLAGAMSGIASLVFSVAGTAPYCSLGLLVIGLLVATAILMRRTRRNLGKGFRNLKALALVGLLLAILGPIAVLMTGGVNVHRAITK